MRKTRRKFTPEFKQEAVALVQQTGRSETQVARELGISSSVLNRWVQHVQVASSTGNRFATQEEVRHLRQEVERLRMEREILKKATAFFAKESR